MDRHGGPTDGGKAHIAAKKDEKYLRSPTKSVTLLKLPRRGVRIYIFCITANLVKQ